MNRATSSVAGFVAIVSGSAICWMRASFMTTMRSAIESASSWLCVTWMNIRPELALEVAQLDAHPQLEQPVEVAERLVEEERLRLRDEHAGERDALLLPARERPRLAVGERCQADHVERLERPLPPLLLARCRAS